MYAIKAHCYDAEATGSDVCQPVRIETVGYLESESAAEDFARMLARYPAIAAVWIEAATGPN
jgi:hypothetical protein